MLSNQEAVQFKCIILLYFCPLNKIVKYILLLLFCVREINILLNCCPFFKVLLSVASHKKRAVPEFCELWPPGEEAAEADNYNYTLNYILPWQI